MANFVFLVMTISTVFLVMALSTFNNQSMAQDIQDVFYDQNALRICSNHSSDPGKIECMEQIKGKQFDSSVIDICAKQSWDSDKRTCLTIIENKRFLALAETSACGTQSSDYDKRRCLKKSSTTPFNSVSILAPLAPLKVIEGQVTDAIDSIQTENYGRAEAILQNLRNQIQHLRQMGSQ